MTPVFGEIGPDLIPRKPGLPRKGWDEERLEKGEKIQKTQTEETYADQKLGIQNKYIKCVIASVGLPGTRGPEPSNSDECPGPNLPPPQPRRDVKQTPEAEN